MSDPIRTLYARIEQFERDAMKRDADIEARLRALEACPAFRLTGDPERLRNLIVAIVTCHERIGWDRSFEEWYALVEEKLAECMEKR